MKKTIVLTGGGTAGHVTPNIALLPALREAGFEISYIGSYEGIEKDMIEKEGITYHGISTGKFRRYLSLKNLTDPFRVLKGRSQAKKLLKELKPDVVFSKGGFVAVPVVWAAGKLKIPTIIHESDMTPGLANKLCYKKAQKICCNFPETLPLLPKGKGVLTGTPIRRELAEGSRDRGLAFTGLSPDRPVLLMMGGSIGSVIINKNLRAALPDLLKDFQVVHLCGKGNLDESLSRTAGYVQYEFIRDELKDLFALADVTLSRAGANAICEILSLKKPHILVPLSEAVSRGDQVQNAASFKKQGFSYVIREEDMTPEGLVSAIREVYQNRETYLSAMARSSALGGIDNVMALIKEAAGI